MNVLGKIDFGKLEKGVVFHLYLEISIIFDLLHRECFLRNWRLKILKLIFEPLQVVDQ